MLSGRKIVDISLALDAKNFGMLRYVAALC